MPIKSKVKCSKRQRCSGGKRKRSNKTGKRKSKIVYVYQPANAHSQPYLTQQQQPLPPPQQPQPGVFTWGDAGKLLAVDVGAIMFEQGLEQTME